MKEDKEHDEAVNGAFKQLEGALCIWSRAKGISPAAMYFREVTSNVRLLALDGKLFQVIITETEADKKST